MPNVQAMCTAFKSAILSGVHALGPTNARAGTGADTFKLALYLATASLGAATAAYSSVGELAATGNYTAGGATVTNANPPAATGTTAFWTPSANISWPSFTSSGSFDCALLYNDTAPGKPAVSVHTFSAQSIVAGTFTLTPPTNDASNGLIRIA